MSISVREAFQRVLAPDAICQRAISLMWWHKYLLATKEQQKAVREELARDTGENIEIDE